MRIAFFLLLDVRKTTPEPKRGLATTHLRPPQPVAWRRQRSGDEGGDGSAAAALLTPTAFYIADSSNHRVRRVR
jgi:hypothetical protein